MPRFIESRTFQLLCNVPAEYYRLVKEALSLRQKIAAARQSIHFLNRCLHHSVTPNFIGQKRLHNLCGLPENSHQVRAIQQQLLRIVLKKKRDEMYAMIKKCTSKEQYCGQYLEDRLWKRIVDGSISICNSIRSNLKITLQRKFDCLLSKSRSDNAQPPNAMTLPGRSERDTICNEGVLSNVSRVTVLGGFTLSENARSVLELGPSFSPSQPISTVVLRKITCALHEVQDRLRRKANFSNRERDQRSLRESLAIPFPCVFFKQQIANPAVDAKFRLFANDVYKTVARFRENRTKSNISLAQKQGIKEVRELISSKQIRLSTSDKGGEFVVIPHQLDIAITERHLQDISLYRLSSVSEFMKKSRFLNEQWVKVAKSAEFPPSLIARLKIDLPTCPVLYLLIKTHKLQSSSDLASTDPATFKVRPIISSVGGPTDRIGWFLNTIFAQVLSHIPAHLTNTRMFLDHLRTAQLTRDCVMESFDVEALYTNVSNDSAIQAMFELLKENIRTINLHGLSISQLMVLLKACLDCNIFRWSGNYFAQLRGLAMGQRLAPTLAISFMAKIEAPVLELRPLFYSRYIDDCFVISATQAEMDEYYGLLNRQSEHIKLAREKPQDNWLPFLNIQVCISNGTYQTKWYRKPSNKNILVHFLSAHPFHMKKAVLNNMFRTARTVCSGPEERKESLTLAHEIAVSNGYEVRTSETRRYRSERARQVENPTTDKIPLCFPYISDEVSAAIRRCLRRADLDSSVSVVEIPPNNLKHQLVRNRLYDTICTTPNCIICPTGRSGDCLRSGVIYLISCTNCGEEYIGETARPLYVRIKEHLSGKNRLRGWTPLGAHRTQKHDGADFEIRVQILAHETKTLARKSLEAFWIQAKNPKMNRKGECLSITRELAPYLEWFVRSECDIRTIRPRDRSVSGPC
ncbi:hypothetical protein RB195_024115 [Necator americanus]|uniref:Reverse transcriptase domain-containing protein n=1 Tax=Necator americanus TaxID=51031 RepID=A0ABR1EP54_NECAM